MNTPVTGTTSNQVTAPLCPAGMTTDNSHSLLNENFDDANELFYFGGWYKTSGIYNSPTNSIQSGGGNGVLFSLEMYQAITIPPNAYLHFNHSYDFEFDKYGYWDGGVLEYSLNNGGSWIDAGSLISAGATYNGTLGRYYSNPNALQGRRAFVGTNFPYSTDPTHMVSSRVNLSSLANKQVIFRFVYGTDKFAYWKGWFVDDVKIYQCVGTPTVPTIQAPINNSLTTNYTPLLKIGAIQPLH
ncbi:MAG: hypothetical protein QM730_27345 [Anaerolineales bacterium]